MWAAARDPTARRWLGDSCPLGLPARPRRVRVLAVITGELKSKIDRVWEAFWSGGIANPLEVIEQITYLLFIRRLDELETVAENKATRTGKPVERPTFTGPDDERRWKNFRQVGPQEMFAVVSTEVFPLLQKLGGEGSTYSTHMKDARFTIPNPALLSRVVDMLADIPMADRDTNGDLYEYMLGKIASAGQNGQFRTPRHIIQLMVEMMAPTARDEICDPACGTSGFLVAASEYVRREHSEMLLDPAGSEHFNHGMFHGYDFDSTMLRIGSMNMLLHGIEAPDIRYRDSLSDGARDEDETYSLILANPPFAGSLDYESVAKDLQQLVKTKKTELLFIALFLRLLRTGGRAAVIVPEGVLFGSSNAHKELRRTLVEDHKLDGVVKLPSGVFKPYAGVSTAILLFTKTGVGGTESVWFYQVSADGWSLDDKRTPLLSEDKLGPVPSSPLAESDVEANNLPDLLGRWLGRHKDPERSRERTAQSFCVPRAEIAAQGYDLSLTRYKQVVNSQAEHRRPGEIVADLERLEAEILQGLASLKAAI